MKLATLKDGTRDGTLIVVSRDLKRAIMADDVALESEDRGIAMEVEEHPLFSTVNRSFEENHGRGAS
jgi:hypothetical protein